jgi:hypothetical protein
MSQVVVIELFVMSIIMVILMIEIADADTIQKIHVKIVGEIEDVVNPFNK